VNANGLERRLSKKAGRALAGAAIPEMSEGSVPWDLQSLTRSLLFKRVL